MGRASAAVSVADHAADFGRLFGKIGALLEGQGRAEEALAWVVQRLFRSRELDGIVVCTSDRSVDDPVTVVSDKLKAIMETLVYQPMIRNDRKVARNDVETLFCQNEACVLRKRKTTTIAVNT